MSRHSREPRRQPQRRRSQQAVLALQAGLVLLQLGLVLLESLDAITRLLGHLF
ncbi:hypothetical protein [Lentzea pudingi]|uniref:hypothetical protein n=1 Tax=Lentzea pudingi TaxID=1789439 RepID=UPI001663DE6F|nr:hypothetical protein [Lentzea pudingi]